MVLITTFRFGQLLEGNMKPAVLLSVLCIVFALLSAIATKARRELNEGAQQFKNPNALELCALNKLSLLNSQDDVGRILCSG